MKKYEYKFWTFSSQETKEHVLESLKIFGMDGWELCAVMLTNLPYCTVTGNYIFKRKII